MGKLKLKIKDLANMSQYDDVLDAEDKLLQV